jgi:hypothetical protein
MRGVVLTLVLAGAAAVQAVVWGGNHVEMQVTDKGATLEFDCAQGTIDEPVHADPNGAFQLKGTFTPERGGPTRDDGPAGLNASYVGTIKDDTMTLKIVIDGRSAEGLSFVLTRGQRGNVRKCR